VGSFTALTWSAILNGGDVPNVVPEYGKVWIWLRDEKRDVVDEVLGRLSKMAADRRWRRMSNRK
jgi:metal-dependent amidase/aminoacylase/carboxypeptidase family protein